MKITFCLHSPSRVPIGGYKILFEYANRLSENGHQIKIVFNCEEALKRFKFPELLRRIFCYFLVKKQPTWFRLNKNIKKICVNEINDNTIPDGEIIIATAIQTVKGVFELSEMKGKKVYFIQGFENWKYTTDEVFETYNFNMKNIVISKWLKEIVDSNSNSRSTHIPNGIDFNIFNIDRPINKRNPYSIAMLYHKSTLKGSKYGLKAIYRLKELFPNIEVKLFGIPERPKDLPNWIEYTRNATEEQLRKIYNNSAIFLCTTISEGFGLTGAESMACGCALVSTAYQGVFEYAENNKNSLISPVKDVDSIVNNLVKLLTNNELRINIANEGYRDIKKLSWENSVSRFEETLEKLI
ncbi:glycosyltransferase family 4 protein [Neobacillus rhizophilus]|uniref:Glycosyltransferase family 4 protein n=1 Tax=Neobacillus rhizophilus TaxID=2833579 RepID=A0A942U5D4_9BACI|nr:glycosyltransferase family 4 protein [Neobacillus rhizophilus]MBS4212688.1 glycosyltransferase family 4 protein [Neobacillus rhizophilus]